MMNDMIKYGNSGSAKTNWGKRDSSNFFYPNQISGIGNINQSDSFKKHNTFIFALINTFSNQGFEKIREASKIYNHYPFGHPHN